MRKLKMLTCLRVTSSSPWISSAIKGMLSLANSFILVLLRYFVTLKTFKDNSFSSVKLSLKSLKSEAFSTFLLLPANALVLVLDLMTSFVDAHPALFFLLSKENHNKYKMKISVRKRLRLLHWIFLLYIIFENCFIIYVHQYQRYQYQRF